MITDATTTARSDDGRVLIRVGHSPDPDDAFMFFALARERIDTGPYRFVHEMADIETLNHRAEAGDLEVSAVSIHQYAYIRDRYALLACGCSMGDGYGPIVVARGPENPPSPPLAKGGKGGGARASSREGIPAEVGARRDSRTSVMRDSRTSELLDRLIAIPGERTTAFLALTLCLGRGQFRHRTMMFDAIPAAVAAGEVDAGLLIHEGQLTHASMGLHAVLDLGVWWKEQTGLPLPLGGNVVRRDLGTAAMRDIARLLKESIRYGLEHRDEALAYAEQYGRGLDRGLTDRFVDMYVNKWTLDYGDRGRAAVRALLTRAHVAGLIPAVGEIEFIDG